MKSSGRWIGLAQLGHEPPASLPPRAIDSISITDLRYFAAAVNAGNFARAARSLDLNTSTISRRIARLEDDLGLTLFERGRDGVRLTSGGKSVILHVRRVLADLDALKAAGRRNGSADVGEIKLGVRLPPVGEPICGLLSSWRKNHPELLLTINEMSDQELAAAIEGRRLDVALVPSFTLWPHAASLPVYREHLVAALPADHPLVAYEALSWKRIANEIILVQGWNESQVAREFYASLVGSGARFQAHAASKQSVLALVAAGFGVTLAVKSQSEVCFPGVVFRHVDEPNAWLRVDLVWLPEIEDPAIGRFVAFMRDEARSRSLL